MERFNRSDKSIDRLELIGFERGNVCRKVADCDLLDKYFDWKRNSIYLSDRIPVTSLLKFEFRQSWDYRLVA